MHIAANRKWADVMSIPRDSWVNIPACRMGNGQLASPQSFKINEAFTLGNLYGNKTALGTACVIKTVESNTHIHIDHFVVVNFDGLKDMVNAVGGVPECNTHPINDPKSGLHLSAGHHLLSGRQALGYVRARYTLGNGSDLERINRQQAFMSALVSRVKSKEFNPIALYRFLDAATRSITIDSQLGGIHGLYDLATSLKNLPPTKVTFFTLPTYPRFYVDPTDTANLLWTQPQDSLIFQAFRNDVPVSQALLKHPRVPHLSRSKISVVVMNGTTSFGLQDTVGAGLQQFGFKVLHMRAASGQAVSQTVIRYHVGQEAEALLLAKDLPGASLSQVSGPAEAIGAGHITLLLGADYGTSVTMGRRLPLRRLRLRSRPGRLTRAFARRREDGVLSEGSGGLMVWLAESRERDRSRRYGDRVRAVAAWKRPAGVVLTLGAVMAGVLAWARRRSGPIRAWRSTVASCLRGMWSLWGLAGCFGATYRLGLRLRCGGSRSRGPWVAGCERGAGADLSCRGVAHAERRSPGGAA